MVNLVETQIKIASFSELAKGWNYGKGGPISDKTLSLALRINAVLHEHGYETGAFPGVDNNVHIVGYLDNKRVVSIDLETGDDL